MTNQTEKVLFCTKIGEPEWTEQLLTNNPENFEKAKKWAEENGYIVREAIINLSTPPDFTKTINK